MAEFVTYRKTCECRSSASGPRVIVQGERRVFMGTYVVRPVAARVLDSSQREITFAVVQMACDECDKEWERVGAQCGARLIRHNTDFVCGRPFGHVHGPGDTPQNHCDYRSGVTWTSRGAEDVEIKR